MAAKSDTKGSAKKADISVGVIVFNNGEEYFNEIMSGVNDAASTYEGKDVKVLVKGIPYRQDDQIKAIDELVKEGVRGIIISPINSQTVREKLVELDKKKIKVVTVNSEIEDAPVLSYVGVDAYKSGQVAGGLLKLITKGKAEVIVITGSNSVLGHSQRVKGLMDTVGGAGSQISIEEVFECQDDNYKAYEGVQKLALKYPTADSFVFAAGGVYGGCKGIYQMTIRRKYNVITFDDLPVNKTYMENGTIDASVCQNCYEQGFRSMITLCDNLISGKSAPSEKQYMDIVIKIKECF